MSVGYPQSSSIEHNEAQPTPAKVRQPRGSLTLRQRPSRLGGFSGWAPRNEGARHAIVVPIPFADPLGPPPWRSGFTAFRQSNRD
jgi:hypothetical protein